jgi:hypothetical protein
MGARVCLECNDGPQLFDSDWVEAGHVLMTGRRGWDALTLPAR